MPQPGSYNGDYSGAPEPDRRSNDVYSDGLKADIARNHTPDGYDPNYNEDRATKRAKQLDEDSAARSAKQNRIAKIAAGKD